jgi:phage gp36-like protein
MALTEFSTLASVQAFASTARIKLWTDKNGDDTPDTETLTQGFQFASATIFGYCQQRYGEMELESWIIDDCPPLVLYLSNVLSIWFFSAGNYAQNELIGELYQNAITTLEGIRDGTIKLYGALETVDGNSVTEAMENPFDDIAYFNTYDTGDAGLL